MTELQELLPSLLLEMETQLPRVSKNHRYAEGDSDLPEMGQNLRASWQAFQKKARTNFAGLTCASLSGRITPIGLRVGDGGNAELLRQARMIWRNNRLGSVFSDAIWNMLTTSVGYLLVGQRNGEPVVTSEDPRTMVVIPDELQPWRAKAALKVWRSGGHDYATVWADGVYQSFARANNSGKLLGFTGEGFTPIDDGEEFVGNIPVHVLQNVNFKAEFEDNIDLIDRISLGKLQRLVTTAMQAFRQRAIKGNLPETDGEGNQINYGKVFEPAPGALWELPDDIDVWESQQTDIRPMLDAEKDDAREYAAVTQTPVDVLVPDAANQSGQGALNVRQGEIAKAKKRIEIAKPVFEGVMLDALTILGFDGADTIEVDFAPPEHISFMEKAEAAKLAIEAGQPAEWVDRNIWGLSPDEVAENVRLRAAQQLALFTQAVPGGGE